MEWNWMQTRFDWNCNKIPSESKYDPIIYISSRKFNSLFFILLSFTYCNIFIVLFVFFLLFFLIILIDLFF